MQLQLQFLTKKCRKIMKACCVNYLQDKIFIRMYSDMSGINN